MTRQRVCILGSTGSVGLSTLEVVQRHPDRYEVFALSAHRRVDELVDQCRQWRPRYAVLAGADDALRAQRVLQSEGVRTEVLHGPAALVQLAEHTDVDSVMAAIVGAAGLAPCLAAARSGKRLLLANKEALVVGGRLFMDAVRPRGARLLPIDSEHSAVFQCLPDDRSAWAQRIDHIVLTASGGPFRNRDPESLHEVTPEQACAHPNWVMGPKISVDSATMMNKALEVIEARWLFDLAPERIRVVLHPQSIIHSMVVCRDESVLAQMGTPDMKVPIAVGLAYPERVQSGASRLDFLSLSALTFEPVDAVRFPGLALAYGALNSAEGATAVLNAANEVAVAAFLDRRIRFTDIHRVNAHTVDSVLPDPGEVSSLDGLLALDARSRWVATQRVAECSR
jgi:1-deoxy-D-xylulose-5-phosphate reductoisomerase